MPRLTRKHYPGRSDINEQFTAANIKKTLTDYKQIKDRDGDDYTFGALTAKYYNLLPNEQKIWQDDLDNTYPQDVQDEIKRHIIYALSHEDEDGSESPIPLTIKWTPGVNAVTLTYDPSGPSYKIEIFGFAAPAASRFAERRAKNKK
jgi:hypothetical protein